MPRISLWTASCFLALLPAIVLGDEPGGELAAPSGLRCEYLVDPLGIDEQAPRLSWEPVDPRRGAQQTAYRVIVADDPAALEVDEGNLWDSGIVRSAQTCQVVYAGQPLPSRSCAWWKVRTWDQDDQPSPWSAPARWSMGLLDAADWDAQWIGDASPPPEGMEPLPPPLLRKAFTVADVAGIRRAVVYVTALGLYELRLNGARVGDHQLAPEWTDYRRRVQVQCYDVTAALREGDNALGVQLADGWYAGRIGLSQIVPGGPPRGIYGRRPCLRLALEIERADGRERVVSDGSWRMTAEGPLRVADLLDGEIYDAQRELPGWDSPGFDDASWPRARLVPDAGVQIVAQPNEPIRITRELKPVALTEPRPGTYVFDLGQNFAGWCRLRVSGPRGQTVTLRHAEVLNPDGTLYTANLRSAAATDRYTLSGEGLETYEPRFTYHGFRYVEVTGLSAAPGPEAITGCVVHSAAPEAGTFECSDPLLNRLWQNIQWTQRANMHSTPTDCPQRDERLGWMGDILAFAQTGCYQLDMAAFFTKWIPDVRDAQAEDGRYPDFAPHPFDPDARFSGVPAWGDAGVFVPWCQYLNYADTRVLEQHFESACRWIDWIHDNNPDLLWKNKRHNDYGDWLNADTLKLDGWPTQGAAMPKEVFATAFFARSTQIVAHMAGVLGRAADARRYGDLAEQIRQAFCRAYVEPDGRIAGDTQAGYAIALQFGLLPMEMRQPAARRMVDCFARYNGQISTGFHSTVCLMTQLTAHGYLDEAYRLITNRRMPSWGYAIDQGATTIWERWDGYVAGRGFQDPGMNSLAHYALGSVGEWMMGTIIGIQPELEVPGYQHFVICPRPGGELTWARGAYHSISGLIECAWRIEGQRLKLDVTVPPNTRATAYLPTTDGESARESGRDLDAAPGVKRISCDEDGVRCELAAGRYAFDLDWRPAGD